MSQLERVASPRGLAGAALPPKTKKAHKPMFGLLWGWFKAFSTSLNPSVTVTKNKPTPPTAVEFVRKVSAKQEMQEMHVGGRTIMVPKPPKLHRTRSSLLARGIGSSKDMHVDADTLAVQHHLPAHHEGGTPKHSLVVEPVVPSQ